MRGGLGKFTATSSSSNPIRQTLALSSSSSAFSTFSGGGGGGGRGRGRGGSGPSKFGFAIGAPRETDSNESNEASQSGFGHGRGKPLPSSPILPSFSSFMPSATTSIGRGHITRPSQESQDPAPKKPIFFARDDAPDNEGDDGGLRGRESAPSLPPSLISVLRGAGRGQTVRPTTSDEATKEENRHLRRREKGRAGLQEEDLTRPSRGTLSREEAVKKAVGILSRGGGDRMEGGGGGGGRGGRGLRGRGRGGRGERGVGWRERGGRGRGRGRGRDAENEEEDEDEGGLFVGDEASGERVAQKLGPETMDKLVEGFEEMSSRVLPSPLDDAYLDALHTNYLIEFEPEYLMEQFGTNPDIDEKPPMPLRDMLEKVKPFIMQYEGIRSQEEWEEVVEATMERVPHLKELIDYYSGPDRVTAKKQNEELERVAKTLPASAPASVKRFTERAVLSLQSNPGWGFDKKCQFMDKLVWEVQQQYK
ncbi:hypothetical protein RJ641_015772 [Dillenia turbinata]|uniref:Uncharacterized protein n=1 Tax=Dillenia turbinata TaxID=194707 RepID=A0AAN8UMW8_9MAGN